MISRLLIMLIVLVATYAPAPASNYNRADWGTWQKGTRASVIGPNSVQWVRCYYTGAVVPPDAVQIDHIVPLKYAWSHGAWSWPYKTLQSFFNDTDNLVPVLAGVNASKGDKGLQEWLPDEHRSAYIAAWHLVCGRYGLNCFAGE